jgi:RNA polymerase sigma factor (sigma-70 family)
MTSDLDLLRQFVRENSQDAFREIVRRNLNLVYSAALRQARSPQLAQEIAQSVFTDLARAAGALKPDTILTAWLYAVARRTAIDVVRKESRRQLREQIAVEMNTVNSTADDWARIGPVLDEAIATLEETDQTAVLLRFFENKSWRDVGAHFRISEDAAQKRVSRAMERLREFFSKERVAISAGMLVALISANAVQAAPAGLAAAVSSAALAGTAVHASALVAATKTIAMTTFQKTVIVAAFAAVAGTGIYAAHQNRALRGQIEALKSRHESSAGEIRQLTRSLADEKSANAALQAQNESLNVSAVELGKLRGELAALQNNNPFKEPIENSEAHSENAESSSADIGRELGDAVVRGDAGALDKIVNTANSEFAFFNTNSAGLDNAQRGAMARQIFSPIQEAFGIIADAASQQNQFAVSAIAQAAQTPQLKGLAVQSLGTLAAAGNNGALDCLLDYQSFGFLLSSVVGALQPVADSGNQKAIAALASVTQDSNEQGLWFMAATGLQKAAASGNSVAINSLSGLLSAANPNVRNAAISGLRAAAANQVPAAIQALHSAESQ